MATGSIVQGFKWSIGHFVGGQSSNENSAHEMAVFEVKVHVVCMDLQWSFQFQVTVINSSLWISGGETRGL